MYKLCFTAIAIVLHLVMATGRDLPQKDSTLTDTKKEESKHRHSIGASLFMLYNFTEESADYVLLTYGYQLTKKDRLFVEYNTWKYDEPMGT